MLKKLKDQNSGFTIIEVLIVLAIVGLIMLIVFMAVPALNRNKRNTQSRNDVALYLGAVQEWSNNNNGNVPVNAPTNSLTSNNGVNSLANTVYMTEPVTVLTGAQNGALGLGVMQLVTGAKCDPSNPGATYIPPGGVTNRAIAVRFTVEASNGSPVPQCQES